MRSIGESIAALRKNKGMTQEALASAIGVSPQSVSKWENSTNLPDIALLPILADIFGVQIDQLFGRGLSEGCRPEQVLEKSCETLLNVMGSSFYDGCVRDFGEGDGNTLEESLEDYKAYLKKNSEARTAVMRSNGMVYYREERGGMLLKRPDAGWASLLEDEEVIGLLSILGSRDFRIALAEIIKTRKTRFTIAALCRKCGIEDKVALEETIRESGMFKTYQVEVDDGTLDIFEFALPIGKLAMLYAALAYAGEYVHYRSVYYNNIGCYIEDLMG